ncbi:MAG: type 2a secretion system assembly platform protein GspL [Idiomarinaceae bacterium HL-53]|nr:MAG: type 2a secretion system assembly platform protein GspL [Idiomarinaceae bacterium HL-53]CUS47252.1 general secretion pathway protein L [Idiomarinaceae bacterium HL-53]
MSEIAVVRLPALYEQPLHWLIYDQQTQELIASGVEEHCGFLATVAEQIGNRPLVAFVDASAMSFHRSEIPAKSRRQARQVVPFALEDDVAQDIDELHFAWPVQVPLQEALPVVVVARQQMDDWLQWLASAGLRVNALYIDVLALPLSLPYWSVAEFEQGLLIRRERYDGVVAQQEWLALTDIALDEPPSAIRCFGAVAWESPPAPLQPEAEALALVAMAKEVLEAPTGHINLCQGVYAQKEKRSANWGVFKFPAIAASVCLGTYLLLQLTMVWQMNREAQSYQQASLAAYQTIFPGAQVLPANARQQIEAQLAMLTGQSGASLLALMEALSPAFEQVTLTLNVLQYDQSSGELRIQANGSNFQAFEQFQDAVRGAQLEVEQGQLVNRGGQIAGTLTIRSRS